MKLIGAADCRIESIVAVHRVMLRDDMERFTRDRRMHCFCFKISGASRHQSADDELLCEKNTMLYLPSGVDYYVRAEEIGPSIAVDFQLAEGTGYEPRLKLFRPEDPDGMRRLFESMLALSDSDKPGDRYTLYGTFYQLMAMVETQLFATDSAGIGYRRIEPAIDCIRARLGDPTLSEPELAALCGYSTGYFRRAFCACMGMPPVKYITARRMERAASMLQSGFFTLSEIAAAVGFANVYYFGTVFKQHYGEPPGRWAKLERQARG